MLPSIATKAPPWVGNSICQPLGNSVYHFHRFVERVGKGLRAAPRDSLIAHSIRKEEAGKSFGFHKAMDNSGAILGPLTAFAMLYFFPVNYRNIFSGVST